MKTAVLGKFEYAGQTVTVTVDEHERQFTVTTTYGDVTLQFDQIGPAQDKFVEFVRELVYYCSRSDLIGFMQQRARYE